MTRRQYPSEINTKTVRLNIGDWQVLAEISRSHNITFAEAFHQLMTEISKREPAAVTSKAQIPMPVFRIPGMLAVKVSPVTSIATNGSKGVAFRIQPKGARYA
ncbi:hypothetical protein ES705_46172 [subsurface metagenome]